ncbi:MAG TPA: DUF4350 domain-containing protein [Gemmatimonadaceae bacterium]|nr:DUF4350 domain-containing protein [Gemmatimonadaceae bacterium]
MARPEIDTWLRPRIVFPVLAILVVLAVLASPGMRSGEGVMRLSTYSAEPYGARGLYEVLGRLGWRVARREEPMRTPLDDGAIYALLEPPIAPTSAEVGQLLAAVRRGASLIATPEADTPLADSLGIRRSEFGYYPIVTVDERGDVEGPAPAAVWPLLSDDATLNYFLEPAPPRSPADSIPVRGPRADTAVSMPGDTAFVHVRQNRFRTPPVILGFPVERGKIILIADAEMLRNGRLREGDGAVLAVRMMEWLEPRGAHVVFSEYHQGYGRHADPVGVIWRALWLTPAGRATLQLLVAGALVLFAVGVRAIAPAPRGVIERRSPLEHVGALARAYQQVGATRLAARRLVRGVRRRHPLGAGASGDDAAYLDALATRLPAARGEIRLLRRAIAQALPPDELVSVGQAIHHIERIAAP